MEQKTTSFLPVRQAGSVPNNNSTRIQQEDSQNEDFSNKKSPA
jgi:hypothetical protein